MSEKNIFGGTIMTHMAFLGEIEVILEDINGDVEWCDRRKESLRWAWTLAGNISKSQDEALTTYNEMVNSIDRRINRVVSDVAKDSKIQAIKLWRRIFETGLRESKDAVESLMGVA